MYKALFGAAVKAIAASNVVRLHPEVVASVRHYFFGGGADRTLPEEYHPEIKKVLLEYLSNIWNFPKWQINCATVINVVNDHFWFESLAGVIGAFNFDIECCVKEEKLKFHCWDKWDFNAGYATQIKVPVTGAVAKSIAAAGKVFKLGVEVKDGEVVAKEENLAKLNEGREFYTRWTIEFTFAELREFSKGEFDHTKFNWKHGGLPKWWIAKDSFLAAIERNFGDKVFATTLAKNKIEIEAIVGDDDDIIPDIIIVDADWAEMPRIAEFVESLGDGDDEEE